MNRFFTKSIALVALVGTFSLGAATKSEAAFDAWICNDYSCLGGDDVFVTDGGAGDTFAGVAGVINTGAIGMGGMSVTVNTAFSHPNIAQPQMDLSFSTSSAGAGSVFIWAANDYTVLSPLSARIGGTMAAGASVTPVVVVDVLPAGPVNGNFVNYGTGVLVGSPYSASWGAGPVQSGPYRMWIGVNVVHTAAGVSSGDAHVVPEPVSLSLLGLGLVGLAARRRRVA